MTKPGPPRPGGRRPAPKIQPLQILVTAFVLAIFGTGLVIAGPLGALLVGLLALAAGALLVLRWRALGDRVRLFRVAAVVIALAVAFSLLNR